MDLTAASEAYLYVFLVLLVAAMAMGSLRNVRMVAAVAGIAGTAHFALRDGLAGTTILLALFTIAAIVQVVVQMRRAARGFASAEEQRLIEEVLEVSEPSHQKRLLDLIEWRDIGEGEVMAREGQQEPPLVYIASGMALVTVDGNSVGSCGPGEFIGEMSAVAGDVASATVTAGEAMRIALIDRDAMIVLSQGMPEIGRAFDRALNRGLAAKVKRMNEAAASAG